MDKTLKLITVFVALCCMSSAPVLAQEDIMTWVKENFDYYSKAPRSEIVKLRIDQQQAIFSMLSPECKVEVYKYKWNEQKLFIYTMTGMTETEFAEYCRLYDEYNLDFSTYMK